MTIFSMVYDHPRWEEKAIVEAGKKLAIDLRLLDVREHYIDLSSEPQALFGDMVLQRCVSYYRNLHLTATLESSGIKVVNGLKECLAAGNKLFTTLALIRAKVPTPRTILSFAQESSMQALGELGYPAVLKPMQGSWGRLVALLKDPESAHAIFEDREQMYPLYQVHYIQERVKRPERDIRCFIIGGRAVASIYRVSNGGDWRTNTARGGRAENCPITKEIEDLSIRAAGALGEGIFGVDLMETPNGLVVHEVNGAIEFKNTVPATGVDIPSLILQYLQELVRKG